MGTEYSVRVPYDVREWDYQGIHYKLSESFILDDEAAILWNDSEGREWVWFPWIYIYRDGIPMDYGCLILNATITSIPGLELTAPGLPSGPYNGVCYWEPSKTDRILFTIDRDDTSPEDSWSYESPRPDGPVVRSDGLTYLVQDYN